MKARFKLSLLMLALMISWSVSAQVSLGVRAGVNNSNVIIPSIISSVGLSPSFLKGYSLAAVAEISINDNFAFQPELAYTQKGFEARIGQDVELFGINVPLGLKATTTINYLELPLLAKAKFGNQSVQGYITAGPTLGYATNGNFKTKATFLIDIPLTNTDIDFEALNIDRFELAGTVGAGIQFNTNSGNLFLDARYTHGISKIDNISFVDLKLRNQGVGINAGWMIPLSGRKPRA